MFIDFLPELPQDDGTSKVSFYINAENDYEEILEQVKAGIEEWRQFVDIGEGGIIQSETEDIDWQNNWKEFFKAFTIDDILIKPTWEELKEEDKGRILIRSIRESLLEPENMRQHSFVSVSSVNI